jgi:hypothetical protein
MTGGAVVSAPSTAETQRSQWAARVLRNSGPDWNTQAQLGTSSLFIFISPFKLHFTSLI